MGVKLGSADISGAYRGDVAVSKIYKGSTQVFPTGGGPIPTPEHTIWSGDHPLSHTRYTDGGSVIVLGAAFYRVGATTDGWRVKGGRIFIPSGEAANLPATVTFKLFTGLYASYDIPAFTGAPIATANGNVADGWVEGRFSSPYSIDVGLNEIAWITASFGNGNYLHAPDTLPNVVQADDGSELYFADLAGGAQARNAFSIDSGTTQASNGNYAIGIIFDEGAPV